MDKIELILLLLCMIFSKLEIGKLRKENERLKQQLVEQVNENIRVQNNFSTDPVK